MLKIETHLGSQCHCHNHNFLVIDEALVTDLHNAEIIRKKRDVIYKTAIESRENTIFCIRIGRLITSLIKNNLCDVSWAFFGVNYK